MSIPLFVGFSIALWILRLVGVPKSWTQTEFPPGYLECLTGEGRKDEMDNRGLLRKWWDMLVGEKLPVPFDWSCCQWHEPSHHAPVLNERGDTCRCHCHAPWDKHHDEGGQG